MADHDLERASRPSATPGASSAPKSKQHNRLSGRLGTQLRGKLQQGYTARGKTRYSLWYAYSPKARADVVLHGDSQYFHFLVCESDPQVASVNYDFQQPAMRIAGEELGQLVAAELGMTDGTTVWRCVRSEEGASLDIQLRNFQLLIDQKIHKALPARVELRTAAQLTANPLRLQNWNRALPYLAQARAWPLHEFGNEVATLIHTRKEVALCDVMALGPGREPLYVAALLQGVQHGHYRSDLDERPWGLNSRFWGASA